MLRRHSQQVCISLAAVQAPAYEGDFVADPAHAVICLSDRVSRRVLWERFVGENGDAMRRLRELPIQMGRDACYVRRTVTLHQKQTLRKVW
jgi:hypothetical protein